MQILVCFALGMQFVTLLCKINQTTIKELQVSDMRFAPVILVVLSLFFMGRDVPDGQISGDLRADLGAVCNHYVNRARFLPRSRDQEFVVTMADACMDAQASLDGQYSERLAAVGFLTRLKSFRDLVIDMNMTRVFGRDYGPYTRIKYGNKARSETVRKVSPSGEYLIAYRMGLLKAYRTWLDTSPQFALVSEPGDHP